MNTIPAPLRIVLRALCFCFVWTVASATAATLSVTKIADTNDGICDTDCSLREAIATAAPGDEVVFSALFDAPQIITLDPQIGALVIDKNLIVRGKGAHLLAIQRTSTARFRLFTVTGNGAQVSLQGMTIRYGLIITEGDGGGGIRVNGGSALTISGCHIHGNDAPIGGALLVSADSSLTLINSTISENGANINDFATPTSPGIHNEGTLTITNSTISGNHKFNGGNNGGGIWTSGTALITNSTITDNQADGAGSASGVFRHGGTTTIRGSVIAANRSNSSIPDVASVAGAFTSGGYNLVGSAAPGAGFTAGVNQDQVGTMAAPLDPRLDGLANYGGPTPTHRLPASSPALDKGHSFGVLTDQRGRVRPKDNPAVANAAGGDGSDIGAFEAPIFLTVTKTADTRDGVCDADCSLREAIIAATPHDEIRFASPFFDAPSIITLQDAAGFRDLVINKTLTMTGPGAHLLTIRRPAAGATPFRIFNVNGSGVEVALDGLTISGGDTGIANGGGINANGGVALTLSNCVISDNTASQGNGAGLFVTADSALTLVNSTVSGNVASGSPGGSSAGGGIHNQGRLVVTNSTISGNVKTNSFSNGGGIWTSGTAIITNSTIADNGTVGVSSAGGIYHANGMTTIRNSIVAANRSNTSTPDTAGNFSSSGYNLIGNPATAGGFTHPTDQVGNGAVPRNPQLDALAYYGGTMPTHRLRSNSPAIDQGNSFGLSTDQRDSLRPIDDPEILPPDGGDNADIGAYEAGGSPPVTLLRAASRKEHGFNSFFFIDLPLTGQPGVECRSGSNGYDVVFTFTNPLMNVQGTSVTTGTGTVADTGPGPDVREFLVHLINVSNAQEITVTLTGVTDSLGNHSANVTATMGVLVGDTNGSGSVGASDIGQVKSQSGQLVTASNFRADVTVSGGAINASDIGLVKSSSGTQLP